MLESARMPAPALLVRDLVKRFADPESGEDRVVVSLPALDLEAGGSLAVSGDSGAGKTTLLHVIAGILPADEGRVEIAGEEMTGLPEAERDRLRARHVGYVFQTFNLLPSMSALENVALGMTFRPRTGERPRVAAKAALQRVGLSDRLDHRPHQLSVGQQQRVAIARALAGRPALVLADEPTSNLDAKNGAACLALLREFAADAGAALLVVSHDPRVLEAFPRTLRLAAPSGAVA
jgi:putative ABC transport system ATP-binding protein